MRGYPHPSSPTWNSCKGFGCGCFWLTVYLLFGVVLDRVPRTQLNSSQVCPICNNPFLEDQYPLVVRLPCHPTHLFDLECVRPWLRLRGTCPLDRTDFAKQEREKVEARRKMAEEDEEEEWDGMYA